MTTEMEADLQKARIEADAQIKIAEINAKTELAVAKEKRKVSKAFDRDSLLFALVVSLIVLIGAGGAYAQHINYTNKHAQQVERCETSGGTWTLRYARVDDGHNPHDEAYEICVKAPK